MISQFWICKIFLFYRFFKKWLTIRTGDANIQFSATVVLRDLQLEMLNALILEPDITIAQISKKGFDKRTLRLCSLFYHSSVYLCSYIMLKIAEIQFLPYFNTLSHGQKLTFRLNQRHRRIRRDFQSISNCILNWKIEISSYQVMITRGTFHTKLTHHGTLKMPPPPKKSDV